MPETTVARVKSERMRTLACSTFALLFLGLIYAFSMFAGPICTTFGLEKAAVGLTFNIMMIAFCIGAVIGSQVERRIGVSRKVSSFTIPLGATINMDGTSIMQGVAVVFAAQAFGIHLSMTDYITVIGTATLASIGTAGVPSVGLVTLTMVFNSVGLPVEAIGLIMGIDRILDMTRTAVNITGDAVCTTIVAHQNKALDKNVFYAEEN